MPSIFWTELLYLKLDEFSCFFDVEHCEHEHSIHVRVQQLLEPNLIVQVQVQAQDPRTRTEPNPGQSNYHG